MWDDGQWKAAVQDAWQNLGPLTDPRGDYAPSTIPQAIAKLKSIVAKLREPAELPRLEVQDEQRLVGLLGKVDAEIASLGRAHEQDEGLPPINLRARVIRDRLLDELLPLLGDTFRKATERASTVVARGFAQDARLLELAFFTKLERDGEQTYELKNGEIVEGVPAEAFRQMLFALLEDGVLNGLAALPTGNSAISEPGDAAGETRGTLHALLRERPARVCMNHRGRLRVARLRQALKSGRDREKFGIMWAGHHLDRDLTIAILDASTTDPVSVLFFDMNGMKDLNERFGYDDADTAIRAYMRVTAFVLGDDCEVYRKHAEGDEVVAVLPRTAKDAAVTTAERVLVQLGKEPVRVRDETVTVAASCGVVTTTGSAATAADLVKRSYAAMQRAKARSREEGRKNAIAVDGEEGARCL